MARPPVLTPSPPRRWPEARQRQPRRFGARRTDGGRARAVAISSRFMSDSHYSHVIGVDDAPFAREHRGDVRVVGTAYAGIRLEGVLSARVRRDGANAAKVLAAMI